MRTFSVLGPRVSVVIPAFNSAWSIERTLASVLSQTMQDFEVIVVDDGSTDALQEAVGRAARDDHRVRVIRQDNRGLASARNRGIREARAALVAPLDADDVWEPGYLAATTDALDQHPAAPFAFTYHYRMDEHDQKLPSPRYKKPLRHDFLGLLAVNSVGCGSAAVFRRAQVVAAGCYDETLAKRAGQGAEDLKLILALAATGQPCLVEQELVGYRHVATGMSQGDPDAQLASMLAVFDDLRKDYPHLPNQAIADARTMAVIKLAHAIAARHRWRAVALASKAYLSNPLWFLNTNLRTVHTAWLTTMLQRRK